MSWEPEDVLLTFVRRGVISEESVREARKKTGLRGVALIDHLVAEGIIREDVLHEVLAGVAEDTILDLLTWDRGTFRFDERPFDGRSVGLVGRIAVDPGGVLLRAAQRMDERREIAEGLGLHACLFAPLAAEPPAPEHDEDPMPQVYVSLDGTRTIDEIALDLTVGRFAVLKAVHALVQAGAARPASVDEICTQAEIRIQADQLRAARLLLLHWMECEPLETEALRALAEIAVKRNNLQEELAARCSLGNRLLQRGEASEAVRVFRAALEKDPEHHDLLTGLRLAAEACGDGPEYMAATTRIAELAMNEDDHERAARLTLELCANNPESLEAHVLRARALVQLNDRENLVQVAQAVIPLLGPTCRRKQDRDAASFFRGAIAHMAPERGDLLRRFRTLSEGNSIRNKRVALVLALVGVLAGAGVVLWPASASSILAEAQEALGNGDRAKAQLLISRLIEEYPDSPEAETAFQIQTQQLAPKTQQQVDVVSKVRAELKAELEKRIPAFARALDDLPAEAASRELDDLCAFLEQPGAVTLRARIVREHASSLPRTTRQLERDTRERLDTLARSRTAFEKLRSDSDALREYLAEVEKVRDISHVDRLEKALDALKRVSRLHEYDLFIAALRNLDNAIKGLRAGITAYSDYIVECERTLATLELEEAYHLCKTEAPRLYVSGRLDEADQIYASLQTIIERIEGKDKHERLWRSVERRRLPEFLHDRRSQIAKIKNDLAGAKAAEDAGDLESAVRAYAGLIKQYGVVRFENVFTMPLRVSSVPAGAKVSINGKESGVTPMIVRYVWGSQTTLTLDAPGYQTTTELLRTAESRPPTELMLRMPPRPEWTVPVDHAQESAPVDVEGNVLTVDRSGRITMLSKANGTVLWARHYKSLEGVRSRPVVSGGFVQIAYVDGRVLFLDLDDGARRGDLRIDRPGGDLAAADDVSAIVTGKGQLVLLRSREVDKSIDLELSPTAGVEHAHDAFWVGGATGVVARVDVATGSLRRITLPGARAQVMGLTMAEDCVVVTSGSGSLYVLEPTGVVRWHKEGLGDLVGAGAKCGDVVATTDRRGRVLFFDATTSEPRGARELGSEPRGGLVAIDDVIATTLRDGRLWVYEPASNSIRIDVNLQGTARFAVSPLGGRRVAVTSSGCCMSILELPSK